MNLDWMADARCRDHDPEMFFASEDVHYKHVVKEAARICMACPVQRECDRYADELDARDGVWAGLLRVGTAKSFKELPPHGTEARAMRHRRQKQAPCPACLKAERAARRNRERQREHHRNH